MPIINVTCPTCATKLELDAQYANQDVQCGSCHEVFKAAPDGDAPAPPSDRPSRRRSESDDDDRPRRRPRRRDRDDDDYDDEGYERPRRRRHDEYGGAATASMVLGICSVFFICCSIFGLPIPIAGIFCGILGLKSRERHGQAIAGLILSVLCIVLIVVFFFIGFADGFNRGFNRGLNNPAPAPVRNNGNW